MKGVRYLNEAERQPLLTGEGRKLLKWMQEHPNAPKYNYQCGDQLTGEMLERVRAYESELRSAKTAATADRTPDWLLNFADICLQDVPFYRRRGGRAEDFFTLPTCSRKDLEKEQWAFVPDSQSLDGLMESQRIAVQNHFAGVRLIDTAENFEQSALPRSVFPAKRVHAAGVSIKAHGIQRLNAGETF